MTTIKVRPRNKKEKSLIKTFFKALDLEIEETEDNDTEITNPVILERIERLRKDRKNNTIQINPDKLWESIL